MKLEIGLKFRKYYNEGNLNNIDYCEVRGIVDNHVVLYQERNGRGWYKMINPIEWRLNVKENVFQELKTED